MPQAFQKTYDKATIGELVAWFRPRLDRLPESLDLMGCMHITNLRDNVESYIVFFEKHHDAPVYGGQVLHLFRIREKLEEQRL